MKWHAVVLWWLSAAGASVWAQTITLPDYLAGIRDHHPFLRKELLSYDIAVKEQESLAGGEDWELALVPSYSYEETTATGLGAPEEATRAALAAGMQRPIWDTGGRLGFNYDYDYSDQTFRQGAIELMPGEFLQVTGPEEFFENAVGVNYSQPLLKNRGGSLDRLAYDLQGYEVLRTGDSLQENQENFLLELGSRFLDWVLYDEQVRIARKRVGLAEEELAKTRERLELHLVEKVDLLRAQDSLIVSRQNLRQFEAAWTAQQVELATQAQDPGLLDRSPAYDLYAVAPLPEADAAAASLQSGSRRLRALRTRLDQIERERDSLLSDREAQLDLVVSAGLKDGDEAYANAADFDRPNAGVALVYSYPLGNRSARAQVQRVELQRVQAEEELRNASLELESALRSILARLREEEAVLALNREEVQTAAEKTAEEERLYEQGRNEFTFLIQSRDREAVAQLSYAVNAARYHLWLLRYRALVDDLLP